MSRFLPLWFAVLALHELDVPETEIVCGRLLQMNLIDLFMQEHPELGLCFYDVHNDGSGVYYSSRLRPVVNMQPKHIGHLGGVGSNVWQFNADTHIPEVS